MPLVKRRPNPSSPSVSATLDPPPRYLPKSPRKHPKISPIPPQIPPNPPIPDPQPAPKRKYVKQMDVLPLPGNALGPLHNPRHEKFASLIATGVPIGQAYVNAGYSSIGAGPSGHALLRKPLVAARVNELKELCHISKYQAHELNREWVLTRLMENASAALRGEPKRNAKGEDTGERIYDRAAANRALELLGKECGLFKDTVDHNVKWDGDLTKLSEAQLVRLITSMESFAFPSNDPAAIVEREQWRKGAIEVLPALAAAPAPIDPQPVEPVESQSVPAESHPVEAEVQSDEHGTDRPARETSPEDLLGLPEDSRP